MGDSNTVTVHLIRHEKTKANYEKKYIGWTDESIVNENIEFDVPVCSSKVYGSDLKRCKETAMLYFPNSNFEPFSKLREMNFGDFEMKTYHQLKDNKLYRDWIDSPELMTPPNGESFIDFSERINTIFQSIIYSPGEYVFVIHGGIIRYLLSKYGQHDQTFQQIVVNHRTVYSLKWSRLSNLKGGHKCESLSVAPIMVKENL